jgi:hypothetical protein
MKKMLLAYGLLGLATVFVSSAFAGKTEWMPAGEPLQNKDLAKLVCGTDVCIGTHYWSGNYKPEGSCECVAK